MATLSIHQHTFDAAELATSQVTVYIDRAEVIKVIRTVLNPGINEIIVKRLSKSIESDSIRVNGEGNAVIREVKYQEKFAKKEEGVKHNEKQLNDQLTILSEQRIKLNQKTQRLQKQKDVLDGMATQIGSGSNDNDHKKNVAGLNLILGASLENLDKFLLFYAQEAETFDKELSNANQKLKQLEEEISVVQKNLQSSRSSDSYMSREVSIIVQADEAELVELNVTYLVRDTSWTPSYDVRVSTIDNLLQVHYYGLIKQNTDEVWQDVQVSLSTAMPGIGGQLPELKTLKVGYYRPDYFFECSEFAPLRACSLDMEEDVLSMGLCKRSVDLKKSNMKKQTTVVKSRKATKEQYTMDRCHAEVKDSVVSACFEIQHKTTIPSDNASHKVTVAIIDFKPSFEYESYPAKSPFAYLKAKTTNVSQYPFLPGPTSVFLDDNFVAKSAMKSVSSLEEFQCSLGVDPSIRVDYKPAIKFHEETGLVSKSSIVTHEQRIEIKNSRANSIILTLADQLPLSSEEKIKVNLIEPNLSRAENNCTIRRNKENNIEFEMIIPKNATRELVLKYSVEYPKGARLYYHEE